MMTDTPISLDTGDTRLIIATCKQFGLLRNQAAYVLATAFWETNRTVKPVKEAYWLSEDWRRRNLRYYPYYGRGYVQLTWKENYQRAGVRLGSDFVEFPERVLQPEISAEIMVRGCRDGWFTGKRLSDYITLQTSDFVNARQIVNGMDKADIIAGFARDYDAALLAEGYGVETDEPGMTEVLAMLAEARAKIEAAETLLNKMDG